MGIRSSFALIGILTVLTAGFWIGFKTRGIWPFKPKPEHHLTSASLPHPHLPHLHQSATKPNAAVATSQPAKPGVASRVIGAVKNDEHRLAGFVGKHLHLHGSSQPSSTQPAVDDGEE